MPTPSIRSILGHRKGRGPGPVILLGPFVLLLLFGSLAGCGSGDDGILSRPPAGPAEAVPGVSFRFDLSTEAGFYGLPVPTELRREADGTYAWADFPLPADNPFRELLQRYVALADAARGAGQNGLVFFALDGPVDPSSLPATPAEALDAAAPIQLMDVDPGSPELGRRFPLQVHFRPEEQACGPANLLAVMPFPGFVLRRDTLYAALLTRDVRDPEGAPMGSPLAFEQVKNGETPEGALGPRALDLYRGPLNVLAARGVPRARIAAMTVFRTLDAVEGMLALRRWLRTNEPTPAPVTPPAITDVYADYCVWEGRVELPVFQTGTSPYALEGGEILFGEDGVPVVQRREAVRFLVTVPRQTMPVGGWPILLYEHGGSGSYREVVTRGTLPDPAPGSGPAQLLARRGIAAFGKDGATNVNRGNPTGGFLFFNTLNPVAFRDNVRQSAFEQAASVRMLRELSLDPAGCPGADAGASPDGGIRFDPRHFFFMGHSTGSTVGPAFLAGETGIEAAVLSGSGVSYIYQVLYKRQPFPLRPVVQLLLAPDEALDPFRPFLTVIQTAWEEAEPLVYDPHLIGEPLEGAPPLSVLVTLGILDTYNPPPAENPGVAALGIDAAGEILNDEILAFLDLTGRTVLAPPVSRNVAVPGGTVTGVAVQYREDGIVDGHNVVFQLEEAKYQVGCFLRSLVDQGRAVLPAPVADADAACIP